jgi:anti-anti-sigma factor
MSIDLKFEGTTALMRIEGFLNSDNAIVLQQKLDEVLKSDAKMLDLDLLECKNISSTGIGKLLIFYKDFIGKGGDVEVIRCSTAVYDLFAMLKLNQLITVNLE